MAGTDTLSPPWQRCSHCTRLGASIPCRSPGCPRLYHFPCATASGSFLSMKTLQLLCPEHSEGAAHLGKKSYPLAIGQMRGQVYPGGFVLCRAPSVCPAKIEVNFVSVGTFCLSCLPWHPQCLEECLAYIRQIFSNCLLFVHFLSLECLLCREHCAESCKESIADPCSLSLPTTEEARCAVCEGPGELCDLFFCTSCGHHYHGACLDTALTARKRAGWQCPECKVCQACR